MKEADAPKKGTIVFLRSCDLHGLKRMDTIYLENGAVDSYYKRLRDTTKFILMGCENSFENCFCVSMGTQKCEDYDAYIKVDGDTVLVESHWDYLDGATLAPVISDSVTANITVVTIPETVPQTLFDSEFWEEYGNRCIACGRGNFVCPPVPVSQCRIFSTPTTAKPANGGGFGLPVMLMTTLIWLVDMRLETIKVSGCALK